VALILTAGEVATRAAKDATTMIPIVFFAKSSSRNIVSYSAWNRRVRDWGSRSSVYTSRSADSLSRNATPDATGSGPLGSADQTRAREDPPALQNDRLAPETSSASSVERT